MANTFWRKPTDNGDEDAWAPYANEMNRGAGLGTYTASLYDDSGTLKITTGRIGINDGTNQGISLIDTVTTISLVSVSNANWAKIEMTVSGSTVTFAAADISGATDESTLPAGFTGAYDGEKGGFYISATKRCIGIAWKNTGGTLEGIINTVGNEESWIGYSQSDDTQDIQYTFHNRQQVSLFSGDEFDRRLKTPKGRWPTDKYYNGSTVKENTIYNTLSPYIPNINDEMLITGALSNYNGGTELLYIPSYAKKDTGSVIQLYCIFVNNGATTMNSTELTINSDDTTTDWYVNLAW